MLCLCEYNTRINSVWNEVSPESIGRGLKECYVPNSMNATENILWEYNYERIHLLEMEVLAVTS
jgi:hypothetical protein